MSSKMSQRDLVSTLKIETLNKSNILRKIHPMSSEFSRMLKDNTLEKMTQNMFYHLAHYLVCIIDPQITLHWPLYDSNTERIYRKELSTIVADYISKSLLSPIMSSYLVNPGSYKMTLLVFQMSSLAGQRALERKIEKDDSRKKLYVEITEKYKSSQDRDSFILEVERVTEVMTQKLPNYLRKRQAVEDGARKLREKIIATENILASLQSTINEIVDGYVKKHALNGEEKEEILKIKNVKDPCPVLDKWLEVVDGQIDAIETKWEAKEYLKLAETTSKNAEILIARQTGQTNKGTYTIEYNLKTDNFSTEELEKHMNSEQKYILKNIIRDGRLNFPNLVRGFLISIGFILKNTEVGDEIYTFNDYLEEGCKNYKTIVSDMRILMEKLMKAEKRLQIRSLDASQCRSLSTFPLKRFMSEVMSQIPPLPDLSDLKLDQKYHSPTYEPLTPLKLNKHQFNLTKKSIKEITGSFIRPMPKSIITPYHIQRDDFFKPITNFPIYDNFNSTQNPNVSVISNVTCRGNETFCENRSGFTKEQLFRLLSTKKSCSKKFKRQRPERKIKKKGGLFNESSALSDSIAIYRSHSSPNLCDNREIKSRTNLHSRKLSMMKEDSPSLLEISGIAALERYGSFCTPPGMLLESTRKLIDASSLPSISVNNSMSDTSVNRVVSSAVDLNKEIEIDDFKVPQFLPPRRSREAEVNSVQVNAINTSSSTPLVLPPKRDESNIMINVTPSKPPILNVEEKEESNTETPKPNQNLIKKTSSLEKIINRYKKLRSKTASDIQENDDDIKTVLEEKETVNVANEDVYKANRNLLPDLVSPSCSSMNTKSNDFLEHLYFDIDEDDVSQPPNRQSLGTALGVDHTFLDQFELID